MSDNLISTRSTHREFTFGLHHCLLCIYDYNDKEFHWLVDVDGVCIGNGRCVSFNAANMNAEITAADYLNECVRKATGKYLK